MEQSGRIVLLRGALELIANSSDVEFMKAWAKRAIERDDEAAQPSVEPTVCPSCGVGAHTEYHTRDCEFNV